MNPYPFHSSSTCCALVAASFVLMLACDGPSIEVFSIHENDGETDRPYIYSKRVDLLLVVDNSPSMADKQTVLALTVPDLVQGLTNPACIDSSGTFVARPGPGSPCPTGTRRAFPPVVDLHIGVISSSLGGHGADVCSDVVSAHDNPRMEDNAHLLSAGADGQPVPTYEGLGFLSWDPAQTKTPPGILNHQTLTQHLETVVDGVGQEGCGFEATLEAWYRFLVDPSPREKMVPAQCHPSDTSFACRKPQGIDETVLRQRHDFLRPDSLLAILMLTDENDCSVKEGGQNYLALQQLDSTGSFRLPPGTNACWDTPHSPDCRSCWEVNPENYPECGTGWPNPEIDDPTNLRCYRQKQRFGIDFLYETQRYIDALTLPTLEDGTANPVFCSNPDPEGSGCAGHERDASQVVMAGILGVPWQDIAKDPFDLTKGYRSWSEVPWDLILGDPAANIEPTDPLMIESVAPRTGTNPTTGAPLASPDSPPGTPGTNPINGFEREIPFGNDLQYACIFDLPAPIDCTQNPFSCDCGDEAINPLCWNEENQSFGSIQFRAKAYPGRRHLEVLRGIGSSGIVASICPANLTNPEALDFGYRPAIHALLDRLRLNLISHEETFQP